VASDPRTSARRRKGRLPARPVGASMSTATECDQLRIRIIALENLAVALLAQAPEHQLALVRDMATHISPRPGFTAHRPTLHAADEMRSLVVRAGRFRAVPIVQDLNPEDVS
jgi:hypothetical protein